MRRFVTLIGVALVLASGSPAGAARTGTIGIRIVDAPVSRSNDPRAKLYIVDHVAPGTTITRRVEVSNDSDAAHDVDLYTAAGTINNGSFQFGTDRASNDLTRWTTIAPPQVRLAPDEKTLATVTIAVPTTASAGERYAVVWASITAPPPSGGGVGAVNRVGVRVYLSVGAGGEPPTDFAITSFTAQRTADGQPQVAAEVHNTGGRALDLSGELRLTNGPGGLSAGPFDAKLGTTLGIGQTEPVLVTLDRAVPVGPWDAHIVLRSSETEREASARITFPVASSSGSRAVPAHGSGSGGGSGGALPATAAGGVTVAALGSVAVFRALRARRLRNSTPPPP